MNPRRGRTMNQQLADTSPHPHPLADLEAMSSSPVSETPSELTPRDETSAPKEPPPTVRVDKGTQTDLTSTDIDRWIELERQVELEKVAREWKIESQEARQRKQSARGDLKRQEQMTSGTPSAAMKDVEMSGTSTHEKQIKEERSSIVTASGPGTMYLIGGATDIFAGMVECYSHESKKWEQAFALPPGVEWMSPACAAHGSSLYVIGEVDLERNRNLGALWKYNLEDALPWTKMASLATPRVNLCLLDTPTGLYAIGGRCGDQAVSLVERYDPETDTWTATHSMTKARCHFGAVAANGALYAIDGMKKSNLLHKTTEMLDPRIGTWNIIAKKPTNGRTAFSYTYYKDAIYIFGGILPLRGSALSLESTTQILDLRMNEWRPGPSMGHRRAWSCAGVLDETLYVIGGRVGFGSEVKKAPIEQLIGDRFATQDVVELSGPRAFASVCIV